MDVAIPQALTQPAVPQPLPLPFSKVQGLKYQWNVAQADADEVREIAYKHNITIPIAYVLYTRGYRHENDVRSFLFSSYEKDVPHPSGMKGMAIAAERIMQAIKRGEKILIFGDYDVDGVTSSSLALTALIPVGARINFFLPNRQKDGYGLSVKAVQQAAQNGYSLIVTVDNGTTAFAAAEEAQRRGVDLIITDHHRPHDHVPPALAIINPHQSDCPYPFKHLAGVGVTFKLMCMIYELMGIKQLPEKTYELLLLGTVADVVPLVGENRFWVRHGLHTINNTRSNAIKMLAQNSNLTKDEFTSLDIGFMIAPQINALGRISDPRDAVKFMISADMADVEKVGKVLKEMNEERKKIDSAIYQAIERKIESGQIDLSKELVIIDHSNEWPPGVIGLVAGKIMHNYGRPTLLLHFDNEGIAKGSCRSIPEFNMFDALTAAGDLLIQFGGHSFAAGLKLEQKNVPALKQRLNERLAGLVTMAELQPKITIDGPLQLPDIDGNFMENLEQLEPFGNQNPQPMFYIQNVSLLKPPQVLKEKHVKCMVFSEGIIKPVIFFNRPDLIPVLQKIEDKPFHLAAHVTKNEWNGSVRFELQGVDLALP
jgi:single-stranded-DNA-specific exonuclease